MLRKILYVGNGNSATTSRHRADALVRQGHSVVVIDIYAALRMNLKGWVRKFIHYKTGYRYLQPSIGRWLETVLNQQKNIDLVWVDSGELLGKDALNRLKELKVPIVLFNHDDPTGSRDKQRFASLKHALGSYSLVTAVRSETEQELYGYAPAKVLRIWRTYDEVAHSSKLETPIQKEYISDICFVGTWMRGEGRDLFLLTLIKKDLNVSIWGGRWQKSTYWAQLKPYWKGGALSGVDYVKAIQGAKVCLGMLSKGNRDLHTTRTMEIPFAGGLLCAERTTEHLQLYRENEEAVFWDGVDECAEKCIELLASPEKREAIRSAGMKRVLANKVGNEDICQQIIRKVFEE